MQQVSRLIDADAFLAREIKRCHCVPLVGSCDKDYESLKLLLQQEPTIDAVRVVRCKDCVHSYVDIRGRCCSHGVCYDCTVRDDFFCGYGAKKNGEEVIPCDGT